MSWTDPSDVIDSWIGDDAPEDEALVQKWIDKAEREIRRRVPGIQTRIDDEAELDPPSTELLETVKDVVGDMVTRKLDNPKGIRQVNTTTGPFTDSMTYGGNQPGSITLTDEELEKLSAEAASGAFSIDMIPATSRFSPHYVNVWPWDS